MDKIKEFYELADSYCHFVTSKENTIDSATSDKTDKMTVTFKKQIPTFY